MSVLGVDLGTTNTVAAIDGAALPISTEDGRATLPSVVSFVPSGSIQCGLPAKKRRGIDTVNTIYSSKRIIGRRFSDTATQEFRARHAFELVALAGDEPAFETRAGAFTPTDVASILLAVTLERSKDASSRYDRTIITVPAGFSEARRQATLDAARKAGIESVSVIDEPTATAWAYWRANNPVGRAGVYDLGGGTFEFSVVDWTAGTPHLVSCESDLLLGGDDVDQFLAEWIAARVLEEYNWDLRNYSEVYARVVAEAERAKIRLCFFEKTQLDLASVDPELPIREGMTLDAAVLDEVSEGLVRNTFVTCDRVLSAAGLRPGDLDAVFLAGGSTHLAKVRAGVEAYFGKPGRFELEPTTVVAVGASQVR